MPSFDSIIVGEDWISEHYFTTESTKESFQGEVLKRRKLWDEDGKAGHSTTLTRFSQHRGELQVRLAELAEDPSGAHEAYNLLRTALGFNGTVSALTAQRSGTNTVIPFVWKDAEGEILFLESAPADSIEDFLGTSKPLGRVISDGKEDTERTTAKLISELYLADTPPKYIVAMAGKWLVLTEQERWAEGRYLAADVLLVADRNDGKKGQEIDRFLAAFGRDALMPSPDGTIWWDEILESSVKHTVGVSKDLREGIRRSIEIIANDVLRRREAQSMGVEAVDGQELARQSLRFLYRILFLLYAEASPELGVLPVGAGEYNEGYGLDRLRELTLVEIHEDRSLRGTHIFESLNGLFKLVDGGHKPEDYRNPEADTVANEGLRFDELKADLFATAATSLINQTKLSNGELQRVLQHLLLSKESRGQDRGFISYAELGINQLGAVYEGLMSYTGFIAEADLHEVAKDGDSSKGSWVVPTDRSESIAAKHFIRERNERTGELETVVHPRGSFVFRLAGRERQQSASYYTPEVLTKFVVSQALEELLDQNGQKTLADDILKLTVCEPALGSGAFAIEAVRQLAGEYLKRKQDELEVKIPADEFPQELQKVKAQIALHQVHGVDLNSTAVELAEVSLWLDTMTKDLQAPWFGLRLRQGNSLIGARRSTYSRHVVNDKSWLTSAPRDAPLTGLVDAMQLESDDAAVDGRIHHFLLPAAGWGAACEAKEVKYLAGEAQKRIKSWRNSLKTKPTKGQADRLVALGRRTETLWKLALRRLQVAEQEARRDIDFFGKSEDDRSISEQAVSRAEIEKSLGDPNGAYRRLRRVMDAWNSLWFWPLTERATGGATLPTLDEWLTVLEKILGLQGKEAKMAGQRTFAAGANWEELNDAEQVDLQLSLAVEIDSVLDSHPWLAVCERIAAEQGFFHWDLDFAPVFGRGGFDLQVGNPPWVRPRSDDAALLAEGDPWWQLAEKPTQAAVRAKREETLSRREMLDFYVESSSSVSILGEVLGSVANYALLVGLSPDLYRTFMSTTWRLTSRTGVIGLLHPESHFTEQRALHLRSEAYRRLRRHWHFRNKKKIFEDLTDQLEFGVHVYGARLDTPEFIMASSLYQPDTVVRSLEHDGSGQPPALKTESGEWDTNPHAERIVEVNGEVLTVWAEILDEPGTSPTAARMVYPINRTSSDVLRKLSRYDRVRELDLSYSRGWHETNGRKDGYYDFGINTPTSWEDVIVQGPHFTVANPFSKQPRSVVRSNNDWDELDLEAMGPGFIPRTVYERSEDRARYDEDYGHWNKDGERSPVRDHFRLSWRRMAAIASKRTLHVGVIPPGAAHVNPVYSAGQFDSHRQLIGQVGVLSSIPVDFLIKASGSSEIQFALLGQLPAFQMKGLLADEIVQRAVRLVCLTAAYAPVWEEIVGTAWSVVEPYRIAARRRQAEVELDALVALMLHITADELCTIYRTQFPVLRGYEQNDLYDANGRKVPGEINKHYRLQRETLAVEDRTWTHPQSGVEYAFEFPFRSFDRETDMRKAYAHFEQLLTEKQTEELVK